MSKEGILQLLKKRPVIGDGSCLITLEKRGYVKAGDWTPEAVLEYPEEVKQLHKDFVRAGSDVIQTCTFYSTDGKLKSAGVSNIYDCENLNQAACDLAWEVARPADILVCGGISPTPTYADTKKPNKTDIQKEFEKQCEVLVKKDVDFVIGEFFGYCEEAVWAIEVMKKTGKPVACTMRIGPTGDRHGVLPGECAVRLAQAGADIIGINCRFDPNTSLKTMAVMKKALDAANLKPYLMMQPLGFHCPETEDTVEGSPLLPETPLAMEPRQLTRFDARAYARAAYDLGVHYIGGCCGFEPHHIREMAVELSKERGFSCPGIDKYEPWGESLANSMEELIRKKAGKEYWTGMEPCCGRKCRHKKVSS